MGIGKRIKQARENLKLTQNELGKIVGVTSSAITNYENGTSHPKEPILYKLLNALQVDANFLFQDCFVNIKKSSATLYEADDKIKQEIDDIYYILNRDGKEEMLKHSRYVRTQPEYKKRDNNEKMA